MYREPKVPEAEVPVEECFDCPARITSKELAQLHSVKKWHPPECLFYKTKSGCRFGDKCSFAHRQVDDQPSKKSKKNSDKSAVAFLKNTRQLGCVFSRYGAAEVFIDIAEDLRHGETNPTCEIHESYCTSC